jgi:nicotinamidase/pyrazinamidase
VVSRNVIFWAVDTQADFMLPGGKLYVAGAEKLLPNLNRLTDAVRKNQVFMAGDACMHQPDDEEFRRFPPHCLRGTPGSAVVPQTLAERVLYIPNGPAPELIGQVPTVQQVVLEKQTLNVFDNPNTDAVIEELKTFTDPNAEFVVFGVVTEYCVRFAAKGLLERGRRVALVQDAIETLNPEEGRSTIEELRSMGAKVITTEQALAMVQQPI